MTHLVIIGNGFDLSLGLKTRYIDFLNEYLIKNDIEGGEVFNHIKSINKDRPWVDIENELSLLCRNLTSPTGEILTDTRNIYADFLLLKKHLASYLKIETNTSVQNS
jgi:hypothetical protein